MQLVLDRYVTNRKPMSLDDYDWTGVRPNAVDNEFLEAVAFVTLIESNPTAPGQNILDAADRSGAPWLRRFITDTWLPEEGMHHVPFKEYLICTGSYTNRFLDSEIDKVIDRGFGHGEGYTELQASTYGWLQELITWRFYNSMHSYLLSTATNKNPADPVMLKILSDIAKQENFHRYIYLTGVRTILHYEPKRKSEVIDTIIQFLMPGHQMAPEWQLKAPRWSDKFNFPLRTLIHDICQGMVELTGYRGLGQAAVLYGSRNIIHWYIKPLTFMLAPLSRPYKSPVNYIIGKLISSAF